MTVHRDLPRNHLPAHPQPLPDELFTHWFMRLAHANHIKAQTLADRILGKQSNFWARDQDKLADPHVIACVADITGKSPDDILKHTLLPYEGILYQHHNPMGNTKWILALGIYHRTRRDFGLQYCPLCLATDTIPYFRRAWRLAFNTVCERHGTLMHDRCHKCAAPVVFFRQELGHRELHSFAAAARCHACDADLCHAPAFSPPSGDIHALIQLRSLATFYEMGWAFCGKETYQFGHLFLDVLHRFCNFLASSKWKNLLSITVLESQLTPIDMTVGRKEFEFRPLAERHYLLQAALWLLLDWPDRFVQTCLNARVTPSRLLTEWNSPYWFAGVVLGELNQSRHVPTAEETAMEKRQSNIEYLEDIPK